MGKAAILLVFSAMLVYSSTKMEGDLSNLEMDDEQALYQEAVLSRELAHSAFNIVVSDVTQNFNHYREVITDRSYADGDITWSASGDRAGPITLTATGSLGRGIHNIAALLERSGDPVIDAISIEGPVSSVTAKGNSYLITGLDTNPGEEPGSGPNADGHGITANLGSALAKFTSGFDADQVIGREGGGDIVLGEARIDYAALIETVKLDEDLITYDGDQRFTGNRTFGSEEDPVAMVINGDLDIMGHVYGTGVLIVHGSLTAPGTLRWDGLVILSGAEEEHILKGTVDIYGGLIVRSLTVEDESGGYDDAGLMGGHIDVDVFDMVADSRTYHEHQYDDKYDLETIDIMRAGCKTDGGLCWDFLVDNPGYGELLVELENTAGLAGAFVYETASTRIEGLLSDGLSQRFESDEITELSLSFGSICDVPDATPAGVSGDAAARDGAAMVRVYDTSPEDSGGSPALIYETVIYRHAESETCDTPDHGEVLSNQVEVEPSSFYINGDVGIHYSSKALNNLTPMAPDLSSDTVMITMTQVQEASERRLN